MQAYLEEKRTTNQVGAQQEIYKDEHFARQLASYKHWLQEQTRQHQDTVFHEMSEYAERAMQTVEVNNSRIQTFAPFRYKYSALQTITRKQIAFVLGSALCWIALMAWGWKVTLAWTI
jgi:type III secretory pathway component EscR